MSKVFEEHKLEKINNEIINKNIECHTTTYKMINKQYYFANNEIFDYLLLSTNGNYQVYTKSCKIKNIINNVGYNIYINNSVNIPNNLKELFKNILIYDNIIKPMNTVTNTTFTKLITFYPVTPYDIQYLIDNKYIIISKFLMKKICKNIKDDKIFKILIEHYTDNELHYLLDTLLINKNITINMLDILFVHKFIDIDCYIFKSLFNNNVKSEILLHTIDKLFENYSKDIKDFIQRYNDVYSFALFGKVNLFNNNHRIIINYLINKIDYLNDINLF